MPYYGNTTDDSMNIVKRITKQFFKHSDNDDDAADFQQNVLYPHKRYPGYYLCMSTLTVYSIKSGQLKPLKKNYWEGRHRSEVSHENKRRVVFLEKDHFKKCIDKNPNHHVVLPVRIA